MKLLYNAVSVALTSRIFSAKVKDVRASCYYHVSDWNSSSVINQNTLLDEEKELEYNLIKDSDGKLNYAKSITNKGISAVDFYKRSIYDYLSDQYSISLQEIDVKNAEFYIEVTNSDVKISNSTPQSVSEIPTSYSLFKLDTESIQSPIYAYTNSPSAKFIVPGGFGAYVIKNRIISSSQSTQDTLSSKISSRNIYQSYPFAFSIFNSYVQSSESSASFNANWSAEVTATYNAELSRQEFWRVEPTIIGAEDKLVKDLPEEWTTLQTNDAVETAPKQTEMYALADDRLNGQYRLQKVESAGSRNHYIYTRDIQLGNVSRNYQMNATGMLAVYIAYIQITLREAKITNSALLDCPLNKKFDQATKDAVIKFQQAYKARLKDGVVDSETKSLFTREVWKKMLQTDPVRYNAVIARIQSGDNKDVVPYIQNAATVAEIWELPNTDLSFQKVTYTGTSGPSQIADTIYVAVPESYRAGILSGKLKEVTVNSISIEVGKMPKSANYKGVSIVEAKGYAYNTSNGTVDYTKSQIIKSTTAHSLSTIKLDIKKPISDCGVISLKIKGSTLGGSFGNFAEGYSINKISFNISFKAKSKEALKEYKRVNQYSAEQTGYNPFSVTKPAIYRYKISRKSRKYISQ